MLMFTCVYACICTPSTVHVKKYCQFWFFKVLAPIFVRFLFFGCVSPFSKTPDFVFGFPPPVCRVLLHFQRKGRFLFVAPHRPLLVDYARLRLQLRFCFVFFCSCSYTTKRGRASHSHAGIAIPIKIYNFTWLSIKFSQQK